MQGATAEVYLHGAHITSWKPAGGQASLSKGRTQPYACQGCAYSPVI